jgi:diguanylate cyclase (GGDEF)-like protein
VIGRVRIEGTFLRSAVARRVFLLFVLSSLVPAALLAILGWKQVTDLAAQYAQRHLEQASSAYGRSLYDRLLGAQFVLAEQAASMRDGRPSGGIPTPGLRRFFSAVSIEKDGHVELLLGPAGPASTGTGQIDWRHLADGEAWLAASDRLSPRLAMAIDPADRQAGVLTATLDLDFLWGDREALSYETAICVIGAQGSLVYCSNENLADVALRLSATGTPDQRFAQDDWQAGQWHLFLKPKFASADWTIVALQPSDVGRAAVAGIARASLGVAVLTILLAALLSVVQLRRSLRPIEQLIDGTNRVRNGQFDQPVQVDRGDEFGQLAESFNGMAERLSFQIDSLHSLSAIDAQILSREDIERVVAAAQTRLLQVAQLPVVGVLVMDRESQASGTLYVRAAVAQPMTALRVPVETERLAESRPDGEGLWFEPTSADAPTFIEPIFGMHAARCFVVPVRQRGELKAAIVLGVRADAIPEHEILGHAQALGDRVAIAIAAANREEQLIYQAHHDPLTGLPNRLLLLDRLGLELAHARREKTRLAVMFIDLDRFKSVNDVSGHATGDQLLCIVGERMRACVRESDTVARLGGDEFVVLLSAVQATRAVAEVAAQILRVVARPMPLDGKEISVGASIGIAVSPADGDDPGTLLKHADIAMYRAKDAGRGCFVFFEGKMNDEVVERGNLERELRLAVRRQQLSVVYQPRVCMVSGQMRSVEALVRWAHPEFGVVHPARFIPIAEDIGVIEEIGRWVLGVACRQAAAWRSSAIGPESVSVNVSPRQLMASGWVDTVRGALDAAGLPPGALELEITESVLVGDVDAAIAVLDELKRLGVRLALDDFGTGYSSMAYLRRMPIDVMKIDRSFVTELDSDESSRDIARAMIAMARSLQLNVVAEGIESKTQADMLRDWSCDEAQGYYYGRPVDAAEIALLAVQASPSAVPVE